MPQNDRHAPGPDERVGIAIVSWNVRTLLHRCLTTVRGATLGANARVVVVDNASSDGSVEMVRAEFPDVAVIANTENCGFTRGNNQALAALGLWDDADDAPPYVLLLNPDTEVPGETLAILVAALAEDGSVGAVGPMLRYGDGGVQRSRRRFPTLATGLMESTPLAWHWPDNPVARSFHMDDVPADAPATVDWVTGAAMMLRSAALEDVGGFDEGFFMYSEELDLCRRLRDAGWAVRYEPRAVVVHHEGKSSEQVVPARHLHFQRSRVRYFRKHHGPVAATVVRFGVLAGYAAELCVEGGKWLVGHKRPLRRARAAAYWGVLRDGLG